MLDTKLLPAGEIDYNKLNNTYIIFICTFDLFRQGRYCYTFEERCVEDYTLKLGDGTRKIFLNTRGKNTDEVSTEIKEFLKYIENTNINENELKHEKLKRLDKRVKTIKKSKEVEARYMTMLVYEKEIAMEAREEGREEGMLEGRAVENIKSIRKKYIKGCNIETTADMLELETDYVAKIYELLSSHPDYTDNEIARIILHS